MTLQTITILGATGSIGQSTIDVILRHPERFAVHALSVYKRMVELAQAALHTAARVVIVPDDASAQSFKQAWQGRQPIPEIRVGPQTRREPFAPPVCQPVRFLVVPPRHPLQEELGAPRLELR